MPMFAFICPLLAKQSRRGRVFTLVMLLAAGTAIAQPIVGIDLTQQQTTPEPVVSSGEIQNAPSLKRLHKKSVLFTRFQVANSLQVEDIADIWDGYPLELLRRLESRGNVVARHSTVSPFPDPRHLNPDSSDSRELVRRIAEQNNSQFVIAGIILDAAVSDESLRPYFGWQGRETGRRFELGLPWNSVVAGIRPVATERRIEVEIFLYDGSTGALIKRHRDNAEISGRATVGRNVAFASAAFFDTNFGEAVDQLINTQVKLISDDLGQNGEIIHSESSKK